MADSDIIIRVRTDGTAAAETALKRLGDVGVRTEVVTDSMARAFEHNNRAIQANIVAMQAMQALGIVTFLAGLVGGVAKLNDTYTSLTNKLVNANSAHEDLVVVQQRVFDIAQRSRTGLEETATLYARLERSLAQYGATSTQIARVTETVSKAMIVSGATAQEANAAIIQLSQGLQSGVLRGDEFRSVAEQAPRLLKAMADSLGVTTGELRALAGQGKLTADVVARAIYDASAAIDKEFNNTTATFSQKLTVANNNLLKFAGTNESVGGATSVLGDGILLLSQNLDTVATIVGVVATAFTGKLVTALIASQAASIRVAAAQAIEMATAKALTSTRVQDAAAAVQQARATLAVAEADKAAALAALQSNQAYYKGIPTLNAYYQAKNQVKTATTALTTATTTMNDVVATATTRATVMATAMTGLRTALALVGGPVGAIMLAVGAIIMWNQHQERAIENARQLATDTESLTNKLKNMTTAQQEALQVELQRAAVKLEEQLAKEKAAYESLQIGVKNQIALSRDESQSMIIRNSAVETANRLAGDAKIKNGELSTTQKELNQTRDNLRVVTENLAAGERGLRAAVDDTNASMNLATKAATQRSDDLVKALQAQEAEADIAKLKLQGNYRAAAQLADIQARMPKVYAANKAFIDDLIAGHAGLTTVMTNQQIGIKRFIDDAGEAFDVQEKLRKQKLNEAQAKRDAAAALRYEEQWDKAYERTEARGATALDRLRIQQEAEVRIMKVKAEKAKATEEELGTALKAIDTKYARQRADLAGQYKPGAQMVREWQIAQQEIKQLHEAGLLTEEQYNQARLRLLAEYYAKRAQMSTLNPEQGAKDSQTSELAALKAQYDQQMQMAMGNEEQMTAIKENYERKRADIQLRYAQQMAAAQNSTTLNYIQDISTIADSVATVLDAAGAKGSAAYKAMFALSKGFAIANATLNLTTAIMQAMAAPDALSPVQKFANMAAIASAGGALIGQIKSATMTGMAHDGITEIPKEGTWLLQKGERVLSAQQNADFTNFMNKGGGSTGSQGGTTIVQHITVTGNGDKTLKDAMQQAAKDGAQQGYNMVLRDTSSRGNISRSIGR